LDRLERRRLRADLVTCYKIINGLLGIPFDSFFKWADYRSTRGHFLKLFCLILVQMLMLIPFLSV